jgi:hypothetical protein
MSAFFSLRRPGTEVLDVRPISALISTSPSWPARRYRAAPNATESPNRSTVGPFAGGFSASAPVAAGLGSVGRAGAGARGAAPAGGVSS